jgi:O-antigen/teichoic acid export membrane protein
MSFIKSFSTYAISNIINAAIPFLMLPVITKYLSPEQNGMLTNVDVFTRFTLPFIILGINAAINTSYFRMDRKDFPGYVSSALFVAFCNMFLIFVVFLLLGHYISSFLHFPYRWILITPVYCFFQVVSLVTLGLFQVQQQALKYSIFQISSTLLNFTLSVIFIAWLGYNWEGRLMGILLSYGFFLIVAFIYLKKRNFLVKKLSRAYIVDILMFGLPLLPHLIAGPMIQFTDRFFISNFAGNAWTGLYNVGFQIGTSIALITVAFNQAWSPFLFQTLTNADEAKKKRLVKQSYVMMLVFLVIALMLNLVKPIIFKIFIHPQFHISQQFVFFISLGSAFNGMYFLVTNYIFYEKRTKYLSYVTLCNAILSVVLNYVLIKHFGAFGAAYTYLITNVFIFFSVWVLSNKIYPMPWFFFLHKNKGNNRKLEI